MRFGFEIETISKISQRHMATKASQILGRDKTDNEHFGYHSHQVNKWGFESDCSVHGNDTFPHSVEIIGPPMKIHELGTLNKLLAGLKNDISVNGTCGLHVHVEMENIKQVNNILRIWKRFEKDIIKAFPISRRNGNRYCKRMNRLDNVRLLQSNSDRYYMVNSASYAFRGTIEFRGHSGSANYHKIKRWVLFCMAIAKIALRFVDQSVELEEILTNRRLNMFEFLGITTKTRKYFEGRIKHFENIERGGLQQCAV